MQYRHSIYLIHQGGQSQARLILACMGAPSKRHQKPHTQSIKPYRLIFPGLHYLQSYCWIQDCIYSIPFLDQSVFFLNLRGNVHFEISEYILYCLSDITDICSWIPSTSSWRSRRILGCGWSGPGELFKTPFLFMAYMSYLKIMLLAGDVSLFCTSWSAYSLKGKFC